MWRTPDAGFFGRVRQIRVADVHGDERLEAVTCAVPSTAGCRLALVDLETGDFAWGPVSFSGPTQIAVARDADGDEKMEVLVGYSWGDVARVDFDSATIEAPFAAFGDVVRGLLEAELDGDGVDDLLVWAGDRLHLYGGAQQADLWTSPFLGATAYEPLTVANLDLDPELEIAALTWGGLAMFEVPFAGLFADGFESGDLSAWSSTEP